MRLIFDFFEFRKGLKKYRRKHPYKYLIRKDKAETLMELEKIKARNRTFPKTDTKTNKEHYGEYR